MEMTSANITQIIVAIIGLVGVIISKVFDSEEGPKSPNPSHILLAISILLLITNFLFYGWRYFKSEPDVTITNPTNGSYVDTKITLQGRSKNISDKSKLWSVIYPHISGRYYPQSSIGLGPKGNWSVKTYVGGENDPEEKFDLIVVSVDIKTHNEFTTYMEKSKVEGSWPGLEELPDPAIILDTVTVTKK